MSILRFHAAHRLSVYQPEEETAEDGPVILRFPRSQRDAGAAESRAEGLLERIRLIRSNRFCPSCGKAHVQPVSTNSHLYSRDAMPVPGSGQVVGFECLQCRHHWQA